MPARGKNGGEIRIQIPEGIYEIRHENLSREISVLPGRDYYIDFRKSFDFSLSAKTTDDGGIIITVTATGEGIRKFELRACNLTVENPVREMELSKNASNSFSWNCRIIDSNKPWIAVVMPNADMNAMKEVHDIKMGK